MSRYEEGFRLADAPSECSIRSKARIDALFEDSRSICSSTLGEWYTAVSTTTSAHPDDVGTEEQRRVNSAVQARIEAMFASVEAESGTAGECAAAILPVRYMGAAPVGGRVASVRGLQEPLRQLIERMDNSICAELEVSRRGLTFRTAETCEKINPFRRIAVWSALRLRCKKLPSGEFHHAFLPLVGDEDQTAGSEDKHADLYRSMRGLKTNTEDYAPIFAVVMRRPGVAKVLECHAFACQTEEDAIAAAATLYRALLTDLESNRRRPRQTNGVGCVSLASVASSVREVSPTSRCSANNRNFLLPLPPKPPAAPVPAPAPHPVRPPRVKKGSVSSNATETESTTSATKAAAKTPKRKKKISDIVKAEDVLEARASPSSNFTTRCNSLNSLAARDEERRNLCNKVYCVQREALQPAGKNETKSNDLRNGNTNDYEKLPINGRENGDSHYSYIERRRTVSNDREKDTIYEKSRGSYDLNSEGSKNGAGKREKAMYIPKTGPNELCDPSKCSSNNGNEDYVSKPNGDRRTSQERSYEDHFRDADKIYSMSQEDAYASVNGNGRPSLSRENVEYARSDRDCASRRKENFENSRNEEYSTPKRISRVETMDKPVRRSRVNDIGEPRNEGDQRVRRRSRAGSEPPLGRTEKAMNSDNNREYKLKRSQSDLDVERGDLMTRVELPRRGSFLTSGSTRRANTVLGGTPLGFTELFDEFRNQEGLTSVDDILAAIIDPEGMSFNDLKPLYKEFLLKLAATLTQDELYQRSASIMRRRRRPQRRRSTRRSCLLGRAIKRSVSRLKGGPTEFTSVIFPARRLNDSFGSSSSCDARNNNNRNGRALGSRLGKRRGSSWRRKKCGAVIHTTSEDSDTCRKLSRSVGAGANRSSSGYVSCSECSYDSESCTCVSADKCYCSLSRRRASPRNLSNVPVVCACDTDSCSESNKCYCARRPPQPTILEQLRQRGIVPSESTLSRCGSPDRIRSSKTNRSHSSSRSLEFLRMGPSPTRGSSDNLALDYDLFSPGRRSQHSTDSEKVLVVSARDPQGRLVYVGGAERDKKSLSRGSCRSSAHHEAFSIKKSAEIAAVFGSDTNRVCRRTSNASSIRSSINLEAGLGYLP